MMMINVLSCSNRTVLERYVDLVIQLVIKKKGLTNSLAMGCCRILSLSKCIVWLEIPRSPVIRTTHQHKHYQKTTPNWPQNWNKDHKTPSHSLLQQWSARSDSWKHPHGRSLPGKDIHSSSGEGCFPNTSLHKKPQEFPICTEIRTPVDFWWITISTPWGVDAWVSRFSWFIDGLEMGAVWGERLGAVEYLMVGELCGYVVGLGYYGICCSRCWNHCGLLPICKTHHDVVTGHDIWKLFNNNKSPGRRARLIKGMRWAPCLPC